MGFAPTGKRRLCTAHTQPGHSSTDSFWRIVLKKSFFADCGEGRPESANCPVFLWRRAGVNWPRPLCRPLDRCRPRALSNAVPGLRRCTDLFVWTCNKDTKEHVPM